ncbi:aminoacyl-tRNA synthetase [Fragilaria crotonensis]|nr:aminoacyl-tRNA synthetase [Fragilaria crotonensis]
MKLVNGKSGCNETIKALWASQAFGVPLEGGKSTVTSGLALEYDDIVVCGDGNAIGQALYRLSGASAGRGSIMVDALVDDWCEWERTTLRPANSPDSSFAHLCAALEGSPRHIVGHSTTMADISIVTTLSSLNCNFPPLLSAYVDAHRDALAAAKNGLASLPSAQRAESNAESSSILDVVQEVFTLALTVVFGDAVQLPSNNWIKKCADPKHGDYQCTAAMALFADLTKSGSLPAGINSASDIGKSVIDAIGEDHPVVMDLEVNKIGFILCKLTPSFLQFQVNKFIRAGKLPKPSSVSPLTCLVDFSSPNIAKEMHVGHLRSTIIGESVCRILEFVGHKVHRVNHVGDWGTQFGMLIEYLKEEYPDFGNDTSNITDLTTFYKNAKKRFDEDPAFKQTAQLNVVKLQSGDEECHRIWKILCDVSRKEFQKVYDRLDVTVYECGESFYNDKIPPVIDEFEKAGLVRIEEGGAKCVFVDKYKVPLMLQKSDGGYGYDSTDMAALKYRIHDLKAERIIAITDFSQGDHFKMCFTAAKMIGWVGDNVKLEHIGFGTVQGEDGKRFKTRSGDTVRLVDLLDEAVGRMASSLRERIAEKRTGITEEEVPHVAEAIGYSAVKYFDLRRNPTTNYKFSYDQMLDTKGNTAVYLLYAHARLESIMAKAKAEHNVDVDKLVENKTEVKITHPSERNLVLHLHGFTDMILATLEDLFPFHVCDFLYNLSNAASEFATQCKVLGSPEMESRLLLCKATTMAMRECFDLVGIRHVQQI